MASVAHGGGFGSKIHIVTDSTGIPLAVHLTGGQAHECKHLETVLELVKIPGRRGAPRTRPIHLACDKGYSSKSIRRYLQTRGIRAVIPRKSDQGGRSKRFDKRSYRSRNIVERCIGWLKEFRRFATRFEKLAVSFLAMAKLACIQRCFRRFDSPDRA